MVANSLINVRVDKNLKSVCLSFVHGTFAGKMKEKHSRLFTLVVYVAYTQAEQIPDWDALVLNYNTHECEMNSGKVSEKINTVYLKL